MLIYSFSFASDSNSLKKLILTEREIVETFLDIPMHKKGNSLIGIGGIVCVKFINRKKLDNSSDEKSFLVKRRSIPACRSVSTRVDKAWTFALYNPCATGQPEEVQQAIFLLAKIFNCANYFSNLKNKDQDLVYTKTGYVWEIQPLALRHWKKLKLSARIISFSPFIPDGNDLYVLKWIPVNEDPTPSFVVSDNHVYFIGNRDNKLLHENPAIRIYIQQPHVLIDGHTITFYKMYKNTFLRITLSTLMRDKSGQLWQLNWEKMESWQINDRDLLGF